MPATPKRISFDDIHVGDTIRVVDVRDIKITEASRGYEVRDEQGKTVLRESRFHGATRTFQLIDRPISPLPTRYGSVILVAGVTYLLRRSAMNPDGVWQGSASQYDTSTAVTMRNKAEAAGGFEVLA